MKTIIAVTAILVFLALGCGRFGVWVPGGGGSGGSSASSSAGADPKQEVIDASKKFIALPYFSAHMEGMGQSEIKSRVDYSAPDRYRITYLAGTGAGMEMIIIGNDMYMKSGSKWMKTPGGNAAAIPNLRDSFTEEGLKTLTDVSYEGSDTVEGEPASIYNYKNVTPKGQHPFSSRIWIGEDTGVPLKIVVEYPSGPLKQMTVLYDTETPVSIEPPTS